MKKFRNIIENVNQSKLCTDIKCEHPQDISTPFWSYVNTFTFRYRAMRLSPFFLVSFIFLQLEVNSRRNLTQHNIRGKSMFLSSAPSKSNCSFASFVVQVMSEDEYYFRGILSVLHCAVSKSGVLWPKHWPWNLLHQWPVLLQGRHCRW